MSRTSEIFEEMVEHSVTIGDYSSWGKKFDHEEDVAPVAEAESLAP